MDSSKKLLNLISLLVIISALAAVVWSAPVLFKGYSVMEMWKSSLLARNLSQEGFFGAESSQNVFLASSLVKEQGQESTESNRLTPVILAQIFKLTGLPQYENLIFVSIAILILALVIFTVVVYYLFDLKTAALFAFIYIFLPFNWWYAPYNIGTYEIGLVFFSLFFLFYFISQKSEFKYRYLLISLAGIFLALAGMSKGAFLVAAPVFLLYLFFKKEKKYLFFLFVPFLIILSVFWLPGMVSGKNSFYSTYFLKDQVSEGEKSFLSWGFLTHLYPDPYTYYFAREEYLDTHYLDLSSLETNFIERASLIKKASNAGIEIPSFLDRVKLGNILFIRHISRFMAIEDIGGPLVFFLFILGFSFLKKKERGLFNLFSFWIIFSLLIFALTLIGRNHLIDFGWIIALAVALGLIFFTNILSQYFQITGKTRTVAGILLTLLVLYSLVLGNHVLWGRIYDQPHHLEIPTYVREVNSLDIADKDVIAIGLDEYKINRLNYQTDKSMVVFAPKTLKKLIEESKVQFAFDQFNVQYILGYSPELTEEILSSSQVQNIASNDIEVSLPETSQTKSWFMNLIR